MRPNERTADKPDNVARQDTGLAGTTVGGRGQCASRRCQAVRTTTIISNLSTHRCHDEGGRAAVDATAEGQEEARHPTSPEVIPQPTGRTQCNLFRWRMIADIDGLRQREMSGVTRESWHQAVKSPPQRGREGVILQQNMARCGRANTRLYCCIGRTRLGLALHNM